MKSFWLILILNLFTFGNVSAQKTEISLNSGWKFREFNKTEWLPATVPGCVHTDLIANKKIEDPFYRDNEKKQQWIGKTDWEYTKTFNISAETLKRQNLELVFEGLDTYANVFLNEVNILNADNMFRTWRVDVKDKLKKGENTLRIKFRSPINEILPLMKKLDYELPAVNDQGEKTSPYTRKAPYQFGWDWGPRFVTSGVWKPVNLEVWDDARIEDFQIKQDKITKNRAELTAVVEITTSKAVDATIAISQLPGGGTADLRVNLTPGTKKYELPVIVDNPKLWYPIGYGEQSLYKFNARILVKNKTIDEKTKQTGGRTRELRQKPDKDGISFESVGHGIPIVAHGANWIPADIVPTRI
ncbi:MAG TPA: hypothetical protein PKY82_35475, partial [Pyrinomonadaceae bacterium]|nr:hypothetical protein [Pyrinomonadaceae bacterium]